MISKLCNKIFVEAINDYHIHNHIDQPIENPYRISSIEHLLYLKCWIDTVQWHMEDVVRNPGIDPVEGLQWKRRIDASNQERTDVVEYIDSYFLEEYKDIKPKADARINSESPAWVVDRLSILALKVYHMTEETLRRDATAEHKDLCTQKLNILLNQQTDLSNSLDELIQDIENGSKYMKVYKQMKMYNDPSLNPVLYNANNG
jgi:DNA-directed RNA polymerase alpha subunit